MGLVVYTDTLTDEYGNEITVEFKKIVCDICGEVIVDEGKGIFGDYLYDRVNDKYYHLECYYRSGV